VFFDQEIIYCVKVFPYLCCERYQCKELEQTYQGVSDLLLNYHQKKNASARTCDHSLLGNRHCLVDGIVQLYPVTASRERCRRGSVKFVLEPLVMGSAVAADRLPGHAVRPVRLGLPLSACVPIPLSPA
jgi:hypothetical protein